MKQLISSSNLFVLQVEMDVYTALKKVLAWGSLQWNLLWDGLKVFNGAAELL